MRRAFEKYQKETQTLLKNLKQKYPELTEENICSLEEVQDEISEIMNKVQEQYKIDIFEHDGWDVVMEKFTKHFVIRLMTGIDENISKLDDSELFEIDLSDEMEFLINLIESVVEKKMEVMK